MTFRATYSFNRDLTVQMYLQPFVAVGDYGRHPPARAALLVSSSSRSRLRTTRTSTRNHCRGNIVLRWESLPRQHVVGRRDDVPGRLLAARSVQHLSAILAACSAETRANVLMVKATYWFNR